MTGTHRASCAVADVHIVVSYLTAAASAAAMIAGASQEAEEEKAARRSYLLHLFNRTSNL